MKHQTDYLQVSKVEAWTAVAFFFSGLTAFAVHHGYGNSPSLLSSPLCCLAIFVLQIIMAAIIAPKIHKRTAVTALILYVCYGFVNGCSVGIISYSFRCPSLLHSMFVFSATFAFSAIFTVMFHPFLKLKAFRLLLPLTASGVLFAAWLLNMEEMNIIISSLLLVPYISLAVYDFPVMCQTVPDQPQFYPIPSFQSHLIASFRYFLDPVYFFVYFISLSEKEMEKKWS